MNNILVNWKTSLAGFGMLLTAAGHLVNAVAHGDTSTIPTDLPAIIAAFGLIFAKDSSVTGNSKSQ